MASRTQRTYGSRTTRLAPPSSPLPSDLASSPPSTPVGRKRPLTEDSNTPPRKKARFSFASKPSTSSFSKPKGTIKTKGKGKDHGKDKSQKQLTQLHFTLDTTTLRTCPICDLTYTKAAPDDESLHKTHCTRVQRGLEWGKEEERESTKAGVEELATGVKLRNGAKGRIISFRADVGGKIGAKLTILLDTINLTLSSPPLSSEVIQASKAYIFLLPSPTPLSSHREKIVGCVIAQRISTAMAIASPADITANGMRKPSASISLLSPPADVENHPPAVPATASSSPPALIPVDSSTNLYVHPAPLPTPMGIPRLFVSSSHRRLGIASRLLTAAVESFIFGCPLDPAKGEVAFTQPTGAGKGVLEKWGRGGVRIYEE